MARGAVPGITGHDERRVWHVVAVATASHLAVQLRGIIPRSGAPRQDRADDFRQLFIVGQFVVRQRRQAQLQRAGLRVQRNVSAGVEHMHPQRLGTLGGGRSGYRQLHDGHRRGQFVAVPRFGTEPSATSAAASAATAALRAISAPPPRRSWKRLV